MVIDNFVLVMDIDILKRLGFKELAQIKFESDLYKMLKLYLESKLWENC